MTAKADAPGGRPLDGGLLFARYAYPPNALGYCGPVGTRHLLDEPAASGDGDLRSFAECFDGAWPYLELIAAANRIDDPLDVRVVEAYWVGNRLLRQVPVAMLGEMMRERDALSPLSGWGLVSSGSLDQGARPHHNFHVFSVYPWARLLGRTGDRSPAGVEALRVLDRCRIRWGRVVERMGDEVVVEGSVLAWTGEALVLRARRRETVGWRLDGRSLIASPKLGEQVALHWQWVCDVLSDRQSAELRRQTAVQLAVANRALAAAAGRPPARSRSG